MVAIFAVFAGGFGVAVAVILAVWGISGGFAFYEHARCIRSNMRREVVSLGLMMGGFVLAAVWLRFAMGPALNALPFSPKPSQMIGLLALGAGMLLPALLANVLGPSAVRAMSSLGRRLCPTFCPEN